MSDRFGNRRSWSSARVKSDCNNIGIIQSVLNYNPENNREIREETEKKLDEEAKLYKKFVTNRELRLERSKIKSLIVIVEFWMKNKIKRGEGLDNLEKHLKKYEGRGEADFKAIPELKKAFDLRDFLRKEKCKFTKDDYYLTMVEQFENMWKVYGNLKTPEAVKYWEELSKLKEQAEAKCLRVGEQIIHFELKNEKGEWIDTRELLRNGPLVLSFFYGTFCPFCVNELCVLTDSIARIKGLGANLVSLGPDKSSINYFRKIGVVGDVLIDHNNTISKIYNLSYKMSQTLVDLNILFGCDLSVFYGTNEWVSPIPATYVIDKNGVVVYAYTAIEFYRRAEIQDILYHLTVLLQGELMKDNAPTSGKKRKFEDGGEDFTEKQGKEKKIKLWSHNEFLLDVKNK